MTNNENEKSGVTLGMFGYDGLKVRADVAQALLKYNAKYGHITVLGDRYDPCIHFVKQFNFSDVTVREVLRNYYKDREIELSIVIEEVMRRLSKEEYSRAIIIYNPNDPDSYDKAKKNRQRREEIQRRIRPHCAPGKSSKKKPLQFRFT